MVHSPFPQCPLPAWLHERFDGPSAPSQVSIPVDVVTHIISITLHGSPRVQRLCDGAERCWTAWPGTVHFLPADGRRHVFLVHAAEAYAFFALFVPALRIGSHRPILNTGPPAPLKELLLPSDNVLQSCFSTISSQPPATAINTHAAKNSACRKLLNRLARLSGAELPEPPPRGHAFSCRTLGLLVELLDSRLKTPPSSDDVAARVGLSPSHFAVKFRRTTGLSLGRFLNVRRIQASFHVLRSSSHPLASPAVDLGFSSQSHFTRVFHDHTGMTPARYRKRL